MHIHSLFNGESRRAVPVATRADVRAASDNIPMGNGWGQRLHGTADELSEVGAYVTAASEDDDPRAWILDLGNLYLVCHEDAPRNAT